MLDKDFSDRMALANNDFIKKNYKVLIEEVKASEAEQQKLLADMHKMAPENIEVNTQGIFSIKKLGKRFVFSEVCNEVVAAGYDINILVLVYTALSQQAHFSDFSRGLISEKYHHQIGIFDAIVRHSIHSCIYLLKKVSSSSDIILSVESLLTHYPKTSQNIG